MKLLSLLLVGAAALANANPLTDASTAPLAKRCIADGGDCSNDYTGCCGGCSIAHDGSGFCQALPAVKEKRCIPNGGDCSNDYTGCCGGCNIAHDGSGFCQ